MYCHNCGAQIPDGAKYCTECGVNLAEYEPKNKSKSKTNPLFLIVLLMLGGLFVYYWFFVLTPKNKETEYKNACICYQNKDYEEALDRFSSLGEDYKDTHLYLILCEGHLYYYLTDDEINELKNNLDFNDTKNLLVSDTYIAGQFLAGYWSTEDGSKSIEVYEQGDSCYYETYGFGDWKADWIYIEDGVFGIYKLKKGITHDDEEDFNIQEHLDDYDKVDLFRIFILGKNKIALVILKDNKRFVLTRD